MKKILGLLGILFLLIIAIVACRELINESSELGNSHGTRAVDFKATDYYWHEGRQIPLLLQNGKKFILFKSSEEESIGNMLTKKGIDQFAPFVVVLSSNIIRYDKNSLSTVDLRWAVVKTNETLNQAITSVIYEAPYFLSETGKELGLSHLLYVKLNSNSDLSKLETLAFSNNVEIIGNNEFMPLWYTLACSKESNGNALEIANKFYETGLFVSCQPDLMCDDDLCCVNDTYFSSQWNLANTGQHGGTSGMDINYCNARSVTQGTSNVIVAVIDEGIELDHPDINVYSVSYDTETGTPPSILYGAHGTECAGIIAAKTNNNLGIAGISPSCPVMSISNSLAGTPDSRQKRADGFNFARLNGAAVISNSWGSSVSYQIINDAISNALIYGRNGKGCVVVFASGNDYSSTVSYPANCNPDIIAVGAMDNNGQRASFSNYGVALDVVAPGVNIYTTYPGYNYISSFSGTSAACPHVAAIAALILSVNPSLTQKQVADIIEQTARKVGSYSYATTSGRPNGTWNNEMGYGLVDAFAALNAASCNAVNFDNQTVTSNAIVSGCEIYSTNVTVSNNAQLKMTGTKKVEITYPFIVDSGCQLEISH
jgi:subtilisin family serine protease